MASYGFQQEKPERLAGIEATWDPGTRALLESLGVGPGRRCLEAGAGGGSIAAWMAERVAPGGSVLATDIDTQHLDPLSGGELEVRQHDLTRDELPPRGIRCRPRAVGDVVAGKHRRVGAPRGCGGSGRVAGGRGL